MYILFSIFVLKKGKDVLKYKKIGCKDINIMLTTEDSVENITDLTSIIDRRELRRCEQVNIYIFCNTEIYETVIDNFNRNNEYKLDNVHIILIDEVRNSLFRLLQSHPLYENIDENSKEISILIIGDSNIAKETFRIVAWNGQMHSLPLKVKWITRNKKELKRNLKYLYPELDLSFKIPKEIIDQKDIKDNFFKEYYISDEENQENINQANKIYQLPNYIVIAHKDEKLNLKTGMELSKHLNQIRLEEPTNLIQEPMVCVWSQDQSINRQLEKKTTNIYSIVPFGSLNTQYSFNSIFNDKIDGAGFITHALYYKSITIDKERLSSIGNFIDKVKKQDDIVFKEELKFLKKSISNKDYKLVLEEFLDNSGRKNKKLYNKKQNIYFRLFLEARKYFIAQQLQKNYPDIEKEKISLYAKYLTIFEKNEKEESIEKKLKKTSLSQIMEEDKSIRNKVIDEVREYNDLKEFKNYNDFIEIEVRRFKDSIDKNFRSIIREVQYGINTQKDLYKKTVNVYFRDYLVQTTSLIEQELKEIPIIKLNNFSTRRIRNFSRKLAIYIASKKRKEDQNIVTVYDSLMKSYFESNYGRLSSIATALHNPYKRKDIQLMGNTLSEDDLKELEKLSEEKNNKEINLNLQRLEHKRWNAYMRSKGFKKLDIETLVKGLKRKEFNRNKSDKLRYHVCLVEWDPEVGNPLQDAHLTYENINKEEIEKLLEDKYIKTADNDLISLDELDLVTLNVWKYFKFDKESNEEVNVKRNDVEKNYKTNDEDIINIIEVDLLIDKLLETIGIAHRYE